MHDTGGFMSSGDTSSHTSHTSHASGTWAPTGPQYVINNPGGPSLSDAMRQAGQMLPGRNWAAIGVSIGVVILLQVGIVLYALGVL